MGVRKIVGTYDGTQHDAAVMVDSVSGWAFGPVFDSPEEVEEFIDWLPDDPRTYKDDDLGGLLVSWKAGRSEEAATT